MNYLRDRHIAVIGGTGTLGRAIVRYLIDHKVPYRSLQIISRDEIKQINMMEAFPEERFNLKYSLGDVRDLERLNQLLTGKDVVINAAAIKHVVMAEKNPEECRKTNVIGSANVLKACELNSVKKSILISSDKAENPVGVYGETKLEAEQLFLNSSLDTVVVRLGNIMGSRGSVWEVFKNQRKSGRLYVTHPEASRFCISQEDATTFVVACIAKEKGLYYPVMDAIRVIDLARQLGPGCEIEFTGLRPGDKLHEELGGVSSKERLRKTFQPKMTV